MGRVSFLAPSRHPRRRAPPKFLRLIFENFMHFREKKTETVRARSITGSLNSQTCSVSKNRDGEFKNNFYQQHNQHQSDNSSRSFQNYIYETFSFVLYKSENILNIFLLYLKFKLNYCIKILFKITKMYIMN